MKNNKHIALKIFLISALFYLSVVDIIYIATYFSDTKNIASLKEKLQTLQTENKRLDENIENSSNPQFIEKIAREKLMLAKKGETVIYFETTGEKTNGKTVSKKSNFFKKILYKLLHLFQK